MANVSHARRAKRLLALEMETSRLRDEYRDENDVVIGDDVEPGSKPYVPCRYALVSGDDDSAWISFADSLRDLEAIAADVSDGVPWKAVDLDTGDEYEAEVRVTLRRHVAYVSWTMVWGFADAARRTRYTRGFTTRRAARQSERDLRKRADCKNVRYREAS